jgi:pullulanase-type alpha-1,6-glucosidase
MTNGKRRGWRRFGTAWAMAGILGLLAACGGGGGSDNGPDPGAGAVPAGTLRVHYQRSAGDYSGWGVYAWSGPVTPSSGWPGAPRFEFTQTSGFGRYVDIPVNPSVGRMDFLLNRPTSASDAEKDQDCDRVALFAPDIATAGQQIWLKQGDCTTYTSAEAASGLNIGNARAMWLSTSRLVWPGLPAGGTLRLYHAAQGGITANANGIQGADGFHELSGTTLEDALRNRFRHLATAPAFALPSAAQAEVKSLLKGQLVVARLFQGRVTHATQVQIQGVLDDVYAAQALPQTLGLSFDGEGRPVFRLWAPTARSVELAVGNDPLRPMSEDTDSGVWSYTGDAAWVNNAYYTYRVQVYSRQDGGVVTNTVTDPYAVTLNANSQAAMVARLSDAAFKPAGWDTHAIPALEAPADSVIYELHVRDFSANDPTVPPAHRGKYTAFAQADTDGVRHLRALASAGLTHVHLLPTYDLATIPETGCTTPNVVSAGPTSEVPQATIAATKDDDCFNWGYDPRHYGAPEGSYATDAADGAVRVREFRQMVQALHGHGLRVVLDVVYNHTSGSFLDRIVPGYYYRLNSDGFIERSTCCENTAPEYAMMEKLMTDTLKTWAVEYKVDGFRFDIMGHIPLAALQAARTAVDAAAGRPLLYYGEAWNFGEVEGDRQFVQARQANLRGTGIGSFSDRIRDAIRGGGPFDAGDDVIRRQGFANGRCFDNNALNAGACTPAQRNDLRYLQNLIRLGMAGSVHDFMLNGQLASAYDYGGQPAGYTADPHEVINYAGVHDGETLFDINQFKLPATTTAAERARAQVVALGTVLMGQGIPFLHAGDELLRSKSLDRDSYNAGDWFNRIDWSATTNYFGTMGLPSAEKNQAEWDRMRPILSNSLIPPSSADIRATRDAVLDLLRVRRDTTMLRLRSGADVRDCVSFPDAADQRDGLIVMRVTGRKADNSLCGDGRYENLVVLINANPNAQSYTVAGLAGRSLSLHPVLATGSDLRVQAATFTSGTGSFTVPGRSVAVFVEAAAP